MIIKLTNSTDTNKTTAATAAAITAAAAAGGVAAGAASTSHGYSLIITHFFSGYDPPAVTFSSLLVMHSHSNTGRLWMTGTF